MRAKKQIVILMGIGCTLGAWADSSRRVYGIDEQPGNPEPDATRIYTNPEKTEFVAINYDEARAGEGTYALEDPLVFADGRRVSSVTDWAARRREILALFEREVYGRLPPKPAAAPFELVASEESVDGLAVHRTYRQWFCSDRTGRSVDWLVQLPKGAKGRVPVVLHMNYGGNATVAAGRTNHFPIPRDEIFGRGYALMTARYTDCAPDVATSNETCALIRWAWGFMRGLDLADRIPGIDASRNVVLGSSRIGKAALLAGAYDERFKVVVPNQTGAAGVALLKRDYGESPAAQYWLFPHWYSPDYWKWKDDPRRQPFDQHLLLACVAPRALLLECYHKKWFDPKGEWLAARAAAPVWKMLCGRTLRTGTWPMPDDAAAVRPPFGYVRRRGTHGLAREDWLWALDFADAVFSANPLQARFGACSAAGGGVVSVSSGVAIW